MDYPVLRKIPLLGLFLVRPRLLLVAALSVAFFFFLPAEWRQITRLLLSWDSAIFLYLAMTATMMAQSTHDDIRRRAALQDEGGLVILALTVAGVVASVAAIMLELVTAKNLAAHAETSAILLAGATVLLSWIFMQTMFALHYAHAYYNDDGKDDSAGGLEFPAKFKTPDYWDFVYFSFIIGTAAQTADINITSRVIRRIVTLQCIIVFFYNTTILALAVNIGAGLA